LNLVRNLAVSCTRAMPNGLKRWLHSQRALDVMLRKVYGGMVSGKDAVVIRRGPLAGLKLIPGPHISHKHLDGRYEEETLAALDRFVPQGAVCYDFGASIGYLSLLMARKASAVYSFEPAPHALAEIRRQSQANGITNIHPVQQVVSGDVRDVEFALTDNAYGSRIVAGQPVAADRPKMKFRTTTLNALVSSYPAPDFIKMDVEGEELSVLRGGEEVIRTKRPIFCIELHSKQLAQDCTALLRSHGYRVTELDGSPFREHGDIRPGDLQIMAFPS
jgi:FkbM family methyltransferase